MKDCLIEETERKTDLGLQDPAGQGWRWQKDGTASMKETEGKEGQTKNQKEAAWDQRGAKNPYTTYAWAVLQSYVFSFVIKPSIQL